MSKLCICEEYEGMFTEGFRYVASLEKHDAKVIADAKSEVIEEVELHLKEADYEYDSNMGVGDNIGSALLKEYANGYKKGEQDGKADERAKVLDLIDRHLWNYSQEVWENFQSVLEQLKEQR